MTDKDTNKQLMIMDIFQTILLGEKKKDMTMSF